MGKICWPNQLVSEGTQAHAWIGQTFTVNGTPGTYRNANLSFSGDYRVGYQVEAAAGQETGNYGAYQVLIKIYDSTDASMLQEATPVYLQHVPPSKQGTSSAIFSGLLSNVRLTVGHSYIMYIYGLSDTSAYLPTNWTEEDARANGQPSNGGAYFNSVYITWQ